MRTVSVDFKKLSDVVNRKVVKNTKFNTPKTKVNNLEKKNPDSTTLLWISELEVSGLVTTTILNIKISEIENKIPNISDLIKKEDQHAEISDIEGKYFTTSDYNKFTSEILDAKIKQKGLVNKSDISNLVKDSDLTQNLEHQQQKQI